jgi:hypothetical protein
MQYRRNEPFNYTLTSDDKRGTLKLGMMIRREYIRWVFLPNEDLERFEIIVGLLSLFVARAWRMVFHGRPYDLDVMDPVVYKLAIKLYNKELTVEFSLPKYMLVASRRLLIRNMYEYRFIPKRVDRSVRAFNYTHFPTYKDVEHRVYVNDVKELLLDYLGIDTRLDEEEREACVCIAQEYLMNWENPPVGMLMTKFGLTRKHCLFLIDFTKVVLRSRLYVLKKDVPELFKDTSVRAAYQLEYIDDNVDNDRPEDFFEDIDWEETLEQEEATGACI